MFGFSKDYKNIALSQVPVVTKVDNLLLTVRTTDCQILWRSAYSYQYC